MPHRQLPPDDATMHALPVRSSVVSDYTFGSSPVQTPGMPFGVALHLDRVGAGVAPNVFQAGVIPTTPERPATPLSQRLRAQIETHWRFTAFPPADRGETLRGAGQVGGRG
jgi:hypothetical protein